LHDLLNKSFQIEIGLNNIPICKFVWNNAD